MLVRGTIDADDGGVLAARLIVRVLVLAGEHAIQDIDGIHVAGVHAEEDDTLIQPLGVRHEALARAVSEQGFARREVVFLGWENGAVVFQARIAPPREPFESVFAVLLHRRVQFAELLDDGCEEIELLFRQLENLHRGLLMAYGNPPRESIG